MMQLRFPLIRPYVRKEFNLSCLINFVSLVSGLIPYFLSIQVDTPETIFLSKDSWCLRMCWNQLAKFFSLLSDRNESVLTLDDLEEMTPVYIGCVTSNQWRRTTSPREQDSDILTMSPHDIERLGRPKREEELHGKLTPMDIYVSDATATSAAAINHQM